MGRTGVCYSSRNLGGKNSEVLDWIEAFSIGTGKVKFFDANCSVSGDVDSVWVWVITFKWVKVGRR